MASVSPPPTGVKPPESDSISDAPTNGRTPSPPAPAAILLAVASFPGGALDRWPRCMFVSWDALVRALTTFPVFPGVADKRQIPAWSPTLYPRGAARGTCNVVEVSCLVLDYDDGTSINAGIAAWEPWTHVLHTSWSHTPEHPRFRVVLPLAEAVPARAWARAWKWALSAGRVPTVPDPTCKDASRLYFRPAIRAADWPHYARAWEPGPWLSIDWRSIPNEDTERRARLLQVRRQPATVPVRQYRGAVASQLRTDPAARRELAELLGAKIRGAPPEDRAEGIGCPACGQPSVWFPLSPSRMFSCACNHRTHCGWYGSLLALGEHHLGSVE